MATTRVYHVPGSLTAVAGTIATNVRTRDHLLMQIFVKATTSTTTFDVTLTDIHSNVVLQRTDITGELNETAVWLPTYGNLTLTIVNASADEAFTYLLAFTE